MAKLFVSGLAVVLVAYYGMKFAIARNTQSIGANSARTQKLEEVVDKHAELEHKDLDVRIRKLERLTDRVEIVLGTAIKAITELRSDIKDEREHRDHP